MAFVPAPNITQVEIRYLLYGQQIENRFMIDNLTGSFADNALDQAIAVWDWVQDELMLNLSNHIELREVVVTDLSSADGGQLTYAPATGVIGGVSGSALPNECAFCVSLHSASRGRSARGRMYLPAIPVSSMADANTLSTASASALVSDVQVLINTINNMGVAFVIVSYVSNNAPRPGGPVYFPVISAVATDNTIDSQRRRKPGVGS